MDKITKQTCVNVGKQQAAHSGKNRLRSLMEAQSEETCSQ